MEIRVVHPMRHRRTHMLRTGGLPSRRESATHVAEGHVDDVVAPSEANQRRAAMRELVWLVAGNGLPRRLYPGSAPEILR